DVGFLTALFGRHFCLGAEPVPLFLRSLVIFRVAPRVLIFCTGCMFPFRALGEYVLCFPPRLRCILSAMMTANKGTTYRAGSACESAANGGAFEGTAKGAADTIL